MNATPEPPEIAAERARERLQEEIARVRAGVEEMLAEQEGGGGAPRRVDRLEERLLRLEGRLDQIEQERRYAEWRIHTNIEAMLDSLLREMRGIADRLAG
ncbi:MAG TPA: hypothetical protein VFI63_03320 [Solirubrobacterales bacterium]|nr:hypothetical protein [Solirubrobacterales bacterium]